jgi:hypothetical protein
MAVAHRSIERRSSGARRGSLVRHDSAVEIEKHDAGLHAAPKVTKIARSVAVIALAPRIFRQIRRHFIDRCSA